MLITERYAERSPEERCTLYRELAEERGGRVTNLAVAENVLIVNDMLRNLESATLTPRDTKYFPAQGNAAIRTLMARFLNASLDLDGDWQVTPEMVVGFSGVSPTLEWLTVAIRDLLHCNRSTNPAEPMPILIPTPYWQGFKWCFENRHLARIVPIDLKPNASGIWPRLTLEDVKKAYHSLPECPEENPNDSHAKCPKVIVLTNPNNPLGTIYDGQFLSALFEWVLSKPDLHVISDEIYANSRLDNGPPAFQSALANPVYQTDEGSQRIHVAWGYAKDFGVSGFRAGLAVVRNQKIRDSLIDGRMCFQSSFDSLKHLMINRVHSNGWDLGAMREYRVRLNRQFKDVETALNRMAIRFHEDVQGAQFFWLDLRAYLDRKPPTTVAAAPATDAIDFAHTEVTDEREARLDQWLRLAIPGQKNGVALLAGQTLSSAEPGWFRFCFTAEPFSSSRPEDRPLGPAILDLKRALDAMVPA